MVYRGQVIECDNTYCLWSVFGGCCHEEYGKALLEATPNALDCPVSLRADFQAQLFLLAEECTDLLEQRNMQELIEIKKFIQNQRRDQDED